MSKVEQFRTKYADYKKYNIEKYVNMLSTEAKDIFRWSVANDAKKIKIYNSENKLIKDAPLYQYSGDLYYTVFENDKILCFANWFL
jgi:hypothetical protein